MNLLYYRKNALLLGKHAPGADNIRPLKVLIRQKLHIFINQSKFLLLR